MSYTIFVVTATLLCVAFSVAMSTLSALRTLVRKRFRGPPPRLLPPTCESEDPGDNSIEEAERRFGSFSWPQTHTFDSRTEHLFKNHGQLHGLVRPHVEGDVYEEKFDIFETFWTRVAFNERVQEGQLPNSNANGEAEAGTSIVGPSAAHQESSVMQDVSTLEDTVPLSPVILPTAAEIDMPLLGSLMYPSVISSRVYPSELLNDCFDVMLRSVRRGLCTKLGFNSIFKLIEDVGAENRAAFEILFGSAVIYLLVSRMADDVFKASGRFEDAFAALVRLMDNPEISDWAMQPEILEIVDWMSGNVTVTSQENVTNYLSKI